MQTFDTIDRLRLEVEEPPEPGELRNLLPNPAAAWTGELGAWGWITPVADSVIAEAQIGLGGGLMFVYDGAQQADVHFLSEPVPVTPGQYVAARARFTTLGSARRCRLRFLDGDGVQVALGAETALDAANGVTQLPAMLVPAGAEYVQLRSVLFTDTGGLPANGRRIGFADATIAQAATAGELASLPYIPLPGYLSILGTASHVNVERAVLDASTITGQLRDATLDPAQSDVIRPGRRVRLTALDQLGDWQHVFAGKLRDAEVTYDAKTAARVEVRNIVPNPSFAVATTGWTVSGGTLSRGAAGQHPELPGGGSGFAADVTLGVMNSGSLNTASGAIPATPGEVITLDAWLTGSPARQLSLRVRWQNGSTILRDDVTPAAPAAADWLFEHRRLTSKPAPAGTTSVRLGVVWSAGSLGNLIRVALVHAVRKARGVSYFDGNTPDDEFFEYGWTGPPNQSESYRRTYADPSSARITFEATDGAAELASVTRPEGVATIDELPYVLEGAGVPWNVNGSGSQVRSAVVVATNDSASALDQIVLARDSALGHAWIDRFGVLQAWDEAQLPAVTQATLTEADYTDIAIDYDTERAINHVTVTFLRTNPDSGETEEVTYGPYVDEASRREWGTRPATFTIQWQDEDPAAIETYAQAILASNAEPRRRVNSLQIRVRDAAAFDSTAGQRRALLDLLDLVRVTATALDVDELLRVQTIEHTIDAGAWTIELGFAHDGSVAEPRPVPAPSGGASGKTLAQLLRPVGEVTMWPAAASSIPAGWLPCDGSAIPAQYAELIALVGPTTPDLNDRFPVGASGSKAVGSTGGAAEHVITQAQMPSHDHGAGALTIGVTSGSGGGGNVVRGQTGGTAISGPLGGTTGNRGSGEPIPIVPPYRALVFIIRAR